MYVRTTYVTGDPGKIDQALDGLLVEAVKLLSDEPGYRGYGLFADRELGKITMGSWWDSVAAAQASNEAVRQRRAELLAPFASSLSVMTLEALAYTPHPQVERGGGFRLGRFQIPPAKLDQMSELFRTAALPGFESTPGFAGAALLADRQTGLGSVGTLWATRDALVASRGAQSAARARATSDVPMNVIALEEFEVLLVDRRD
ncbi:antibiotic biosynthesis monooxygenase [Streptacidiphilus rugosus]|uniref:antibiotic biosynthesis monooxygenase n=1 Tax=Streptacidiphilus rugosus TaxID=405783 RepID=UPI000566980D|nr:antibiotic biosynthesis monooxygenase [Streptacidiphilus rugosus]